MNNPTNQPSHRPSLSASLAEEIGHALSENEGTRLIVIAHLTEIIQRRVEPLERALEAIATAHDAKEKHSGEIMQGVAKHALARLKEGR